jgi:hypothetical protein
MKISKNTKIFVSVLVGGLLAYGYNRFRKGDVTSTTTVKNGEKDSADNPTTREGKIEYIMANTQTTATEEKTGFDGERFTWNPQLQYLMPRGVVSVGDSGGRMIIGKQGNLANEIYFNVDGVETNDPTQVADAILSEMSDEQLDVAYKVVKAKKNNPNLDDDKIMTGLGVSNEKRRDFRAYIKSKIQDLKGLMKTSNWKEKWEKRKKRFENKFDDSDMKPKPSETAIQKRPLKVSEKQLIAKKLDTNFKHQVTNRNAGSIWGGHRNDGLSTNFANNKRSE